MRGTMNRNRNDEHRYEDIINLPRHVSKTHPPMSRMGRAAQFSPFAALTGYGDAVKKTARLTEDRIELDESRRAVLEERLQILLALKDRKPQASVTWFQPDGKKAGGRYLTHTGFLRKYDEQERLLVMEDGTRIPLDEVRDVEGDAFFDMENG